MKEKEKGKQRNKYGGERRKRERRKCMVEREGKYEREIEREYWKPKSLQSFSKTWKICHVNHGCQFISYPLPLAMNNFPIWNA